MLFLLANIFGVALFALVEFPESRPVFIAEYLTDHYNVTSYFISKLTIDALVVLPIVTTMVRACARFCAVRERILFCFSLLAYTFFSNNSF